MEAKERQKASSHAAKCSSHTLERLVAELVVLVVRDASARRRARGLASAHAGPARDSGGKEHVNLAFYYHNTLLFN
ncbi:hypothetical protein RR48_07981 [Papilio machaon]|uniref:Uncharacterized protein n=1 Tax=Papilio machaon TaxID=76193 RepID=A0A194QP56_PAPMA|nr:hypothetical protein RR48_07981 [Papilio machaon]